MSKGRIKDSIHCFIQLTIIGHNNGVLTTHLGDDFFLHHKTVLGMLYKLGRIFTVKKLSYGLGTRKDNSGHIFMINHSTGHFRSIPLNKVESISRNTCFKKKLVKLLSNKWSLLCRFKNNNVAGH